MCSVLSPIIAQYVLDHILSKIIPHLNYKIAFVKKSVSDIIPKPECNEFDNHIKFTITLETNCTIPFLHMLVIRNQNNNIHFISMFYQINQRT